MKECNNVKQSPIAGLAAYGGGSGSVIFGRKGVDGYTIDRSLRFNSADSAYLGRTPSSASNRRTFTFSTWVKRHKLGTDQKLFGVNSAWFTFYFTSSDNLRVYYENSGSQYFTTNAVFRDPSAWYHIVLKVDTTQSTASDRVKIYVNSEELTFSASGNTSQNYEFGVNTTNAHDIGMRSSESIMKADFNLADVHFIDGQALTPSSFGKSDADTGVWNPKRFSGAFGTNGFHLKFADNSSNSALGTDSSSNSNTWTVNNLSVAAGSGNDSLIDSPTNYEADSGNNGGNYATMNPVGQTKTQYFTENGNLVCGNSSVPSGSSGSRGFVPSTIGFKTGKWYCECVTTKASDGDKDFAIGIFPADSTGYYSTSGHYAVRQEGTLFSPAGVNQSYGTSFGDGDVIGIAVDMDSSTKTIQWFKNGTAIASATTIADKEYFFGYGSDGGGGGRTYRATWNFGQRPFAYTPPSNHLALCTQNLPEPTIAYGSTAMDVALWTGTGATRSITGLGFSPDFVWIKKRSGTTAHNLFDVVRGASKPLFSNLTNAELSDGRLTAFNSDGFTLDSDNAVNDNNQTHVGWTWDAGANSNKTYTVKVVSDSGNKYRFDDFGTSAVTLDLAEGSTYIFDQSDSSNSGHPLRFSTTSNGTHGGGTEYTTGVTVTGTPGQAGAKTTIVVAASAPTLYYYCSVHSGMGGQANTNSTAGSSNFDGSIQATAKANQTAGFSIVTGSGNSGTVGHGLNAKPDLVIVKQRNNTVAWAVAHSGLGAMKDNIIYLNGLNANTTSSNFWGSSNFDSSVFPISSNICTSGATFVAYCFAAVAGYSAFGSYNGNGSDDGPFVYTGFRPKFILTKAYSSNSNNNNNWNIHDTSRDPHNEASEILAPNNANVTLDNAHTGIDILSNGFKLKGDTNGQSNYNGWDYIYYAVAEHPFKTARAR